MATRPYFARFDGEDIAGKRYALGAQIEDDVHPAVLQILAQQGRISQDEPVKGIVRDEEPALEDMNRAELERAAVAVFTAQLADMDDDSIREGIERHRDAEDERNGTNDGGRGDGSTGGTAYADLKDKPLGTLKTAELDTIAREEHVSFDGAKNNADRVKAIEAAREAKTAN